MPASIGPYMENARIILEGLGKAGYRATTYGALRTLRTVPLRTVLRTVRYVRCATYYVHLRTVPVT